MNWGWSNPEVYINALRVKDRTKMTIIESLMIGQMEELDHLNEEVNALRIAYENREPEVKFPFPLEGRFKDEVLRHFHYWKKYRTIDIEDVYIYHFNIL